METYTLWDGSAPYDDPAIDQIQPTIEVYPADTSEPCAAVLVCPGGAYSHRAEDKEGRLICRLFAENGITGVMLQYRVAPYHYPVQLLDVQRGMRFLRYHAERLHIDPKRIGVMGFSAGGHLAVMALEQYDEGRETGDAIDRVTCRPDLGILCYSVSTLDQPYSHHGSARNLLGEKGLADEALVHRLSGENSVRDDCPPVFLWHTAEDRSVPVQNSLTMVAALREKKVPCELHVFPDGPHGLGLARDIPGTRQWSGLMIDFAHRYGF